MNGLPVASGESISDSLDLLAQLLESQLGDWRCAILLAADDGLSLHCAAAPRLAKDFPAAVAGLAVAAGSMLADLGQRQVVDDVAAADCPPLLRQLAGLAGFAACVAEPLRGRDGRLLGCLLAACEQRRPPRDDELAALAQGSRLGARVIEQQRAAENLRQSRDTFHGLFDSVDEILFVFDKERRVVDASARAKKLFEHAPGGLIGRRYEEFGAPGLNDEAEVESRIAAALAGQPQSFEYWVDAVAGRILPTEIRLRPGHYFGDAVLIASAIDISERKSASLYLRIQHDLSNALVDGDDSRPAVQAAIVRSGLSFPEFTASALYGRRADGGFQLLSQEGFSSAFAAAAGEYGPDSPFAKIAADAALFSCHDGTASALACPIGHALAQSEALRYLQVLPIPVDGKVEACLILGNRHAQQLSTATPDMFDRLRHLCGHILHRLAVREESRRQKKNFSGLLDALDDFIFVTDPDGRILHHNLAVSRVLGYAPGALIGQPITTLNPPEFRAAGAAIITGQNQHARVPLQSADGRLVTVDASILSGHWNGQPARIGVGRDISERLRAEEQQ
ncbi:MAG: PAS domain S-box protein, partial [Desulfobulbus sp.]|nr:PAS domain S-box protein [Desulfobulbus sp.]